jgi:hypothetical protein
VRREPIETRKSTLRSLLRGKHAGIAFNAHFIADGAIVYRQACALGCEGIVSKRLGSPYRSGRADCWVKIKNPAAPAVTREAEEDWNWKTEIKVFEDRINLANAARLARQRERESAEPCHTDDDGNCESRLYPNPINKQRELAHDHLPDVLRGSMALLYRES